MQWLPAVNSLRQDRQATTAAAQCRVIGDGDVDLEHVGDRSQQTLRLSQRLMEYQAEREARLDGDRRVDQLTARPCPPSWCMIAVDKWGAVATVQSLAAAAHLSPAVRALPGGHRRSSF